MRLVFPSVKYKDSYLEALHEAEGETGLSVLRRPKQGESFEEFVNILKGEARGLNLPEGFVPATELWMIDKGEFIGRVSIRHSLTENLLKLGGHIGYYIRISKRGMGYGKKILELALKKAGQLGVEKALITCDIGNTASSKVIEANKGVLENIVKVGKGLPLKKRYWISLK